MVRSTRLLIATLLVVLSACYGSILEPPAESAGPTWGPPAGTLLPPVPVDPAWLESVAELPANELFGAVAEEIGVPADLLRAVAYAETAFVPEARWTTPDEARIAEAAAISGLDAGLLGSDRAAHVAGGAARLASFALHLDSDVEASVADSAWWDAVAASSSLDDPWLADAYAGLVFRHLQTGFVAATSAVATMDQPDVVVLSPSPVQSLGAVSVEGPPPSLHFAPEYPPAASALMAAGGSTRVGEVGRIELTATNVSWAHSLADLLDSGRSTYLVRRADGQVTQLLPEGVAPAAGADDEIVVALTALADGHGAWSPQLLEGAARLTAYLAWRHDLPVDEAHVGGDFGGDFPYEPWLEMASCFADGGGDACATGLAGSPGGFVPPPDLDDDGGGRTEARSVSLPYFYQYANAHYPSATCQNTSIAMVLKWAGWSGTPDDITARFGKNLAQSPAGLAQVFNTLADEAGLSARITPNTSGSLEDLRAQLAAGRPTIVHGYFTGYGHVMVALGYDGSRYTVNDPAGRWAQTWKGGYPYGWEPTAGKGARYGKAAFEQAVATSNGSSYLPLWYHELTGMPGASADDPPADPDPDPDPGGSGDGGSGDGGSGDGGSGSGDYPWASVQFLEPVDGQIVGDPLLLRATREGGRRIEFWSDSYLLGESFANPGSSLVDIYTHSERNLRARNVSQWGTVLAVHDIRVTIEPTVEMQLFATNQGDDVWQFGAEPGVDDAAFVTYHVDGHLLSDLDSGSAHATGPGFALAYRFSEHAPERHLVGRAYDTSGDLLAQGDKLIAVDGAPGAECHVAGFIECGRVVDGDTSGSSASDVLNGYPDFVGNYDGPEVGFRFVAPSSGEIELRFIDPEPGSFDLDIFLLEQGIGQCTSGDVVARGFNSLTVEVHAGGQYVVVVDGFAGDAGPFQLELDCGR